MVYFKGQKPATAEEREHLTRVRALPCCVCLPNEQTSHTQAHHLLDSGKRISHYHTIPLCDQHHRVINTLPQRQLCVQIATTLGIEISFPTSKIIPRRTA